MSDAVQSVVEPYMIGQPWEDIINLITTNNTNEESIVILAWVGYFLKFIPILSLVGWILDFVLDILQFLKSGDRGTIYAFILDKANYPDDVSYHTKIEEYVYDLNFTRDSDIASGSAYNISLMFFPLVLTFVFNPATWIWQFGFMLLTWPYQFLYIFFATIPSF